MYLCVVSKDDLLLFEHDFKDPSFKVEGITQFLLHSTLDLVDLKSTSTDEMDLKEIDTFDKNAISCFVTASNHRFMLMYNKNRLTERKISAFFDQIYAAFVKMQMDPFYNYDDQINSTEFLESVKKSGSLL
ncbi:Trafficking protein particle complex subunit 2 [Bonamia ostreae]|uniref:Trafficking protein particle complex subunit 2 n=1 Tax=Bonamia ostreae TaxID=126728 RepID=A0ABV2ALU9_9EUKA